MADQIDVEVTLSEVLAKLSDSGAVRRAVMEIAEKKAGGKPIGNIKMNRTRGGALGEKELDGIVGGVANLSAPSTVAYSSLRAPGAVAGFADTFW